MKWPARTCVDAASVVPAATVANHSLKEIIMNKQTSLNFPLAAFLLVALLGASTAGAQTNTKYGTGALGNPSSSFLFDSAFGYGALSSPTSGEFNTAVGA